MQEVVQEVFSHARVFPPVSELLYTEEHGGQCASGLTLQSLIANAVTVHDTGAERDSCGKVEFTGCSKRRQTHVHLESPLSTAASREMHPLRCMIGLPGLSCFKSSELWLPNSAHGRDLERMRWHISYIISFRERVDQRSSTASTSSTFYSDHLQHPCELRCALIGSDGYADE